MKFTLLVNGKDMTFSEQELIDIIEYLAKKKIEEGYEESTEDDIDNSEDDNCNCDGENEVDTSKIVNGPTEGTPFKVCPQKISQKLFQKKRADFDEEAVRQLINEAFVALKENPERYGKDFYTLIPKTTWNLKTTKTVEDLRNMACELGDHMADWVEKAFEWAQRIANGEKWEAVRNDKATCYILIEWKTGCARIVGEPNTLSSTIPATFIYDKDYNFSDSLSCTKPLAVLYEQNDSLLVS